MSGACTRKQEAWLTLEKYYKSHKKLVSITGEALRMLWYDPIQSKEGISNPEIEVFLKTLLLF